MKSLVCFHSNGKKISFSNSSVGFFTFRRRAASTGSHIRLLLYAECCHLVRVCVSERSMRWIFHDDFSGKKVSEIYIFFFRFSERNEMWKRFSSKNVADAHEITSSQRPKFWIFRSTFLCPLSSILCVCAVVAINKSTLPFHLLRFLLSPSGNRCLTAINSSRCVCAEWVAAEAWRNFVHLSCLSAGWRIHILAQRLWTQAHMGDIECRLPPKRMKEKTNFLI